MSSFYKSLDEYVQATMNRMESKDPNLTKLLIDDFHYPEVDLESDQFFDSVTIARLLRKAVKSPFIKELEMRFVELDDIVGMALKELFSESPCRLWESISIVGCTGCDGEFLEPLTLAMKQCKHLSLNHNNLDKNGFEQIGTALESTQSLKSFHMKRNTLYETNSKALFRSLRSNTQLKEMVLNFCRFDDKGVDVLSDSLQHNRTIQTLDLGACYLPDKFVAKVIHSLVGHPALTSLVLTLNSCHEEGTEALASLLSSADCQLVHLNMSHQKAGSNKPCMATLARALERNTSLRSLKLSRNSLVGHDLSCLLQSLQQNTTLEHLDLANNSLDDASLIALAQALPHMHGLKSLHILNNCVINETAVGNAILSGMTCNYTLVDLAIKSSLSRYQEIQYFAALNWGGRRALSASVVGGETLPSIPLGLWPRVLERAQLKSRNRPQSKNCTDPSKTPQVTNPEKVNVVQDFSKIEPFQHDIIFHLLHGPSVLCQ